LSLVFFDHRLNFFFLFCIKNAFYFGNQLDSDFRKTSVDFASQTFEAFFVVLENEKKEQSRWF